MKTVICDIEGTIFKYVGNGHYGVVHNPPKILDLNNSDIKIKKEIDKVLVKKKSWIFW